MEMTIRREHGKYPNADVYSVVFTRGHHLMACNHLAITSAESLFRNPGLHPIVDMFIRDKVASSLDNRVPYVLSDIQGSLKNHLLNVTALHCELPHAGPEYQFGCDRAKSVNKKCCHRMTYASVAALAAFPYAQRMPQTETVKARVGYSVSPYKATVRTFTKIDHLILQDGHSRNGNHAMPEGQVLQIKAALASYNKRLRQENFVSESTTVESDVASVHANFNAQNLFVRWEKMRSTDPSEHLNLKLFEWNLIGLLYRKRTPEEINAARRTQDPQGPVWEDGDLPPVTDPRNLPYEFVAVYASLFSLICGVKAWACRKVLGHVQITADNMYNCLTGVPNMYWFNVGVHDAKNIVFPTVNALQLGRQAPRNEVGHEV